MHDDNTSDDASGKIGKVMTILAWLAGLVLLTIFFSDQLSQQLNPNQQPLSAVTKQGVEVSLKRNRQGHYVTSGEINGNDVVFLLDTGATHVSIPYHLGTSLGLEPGYRQRVMTANGPVNVASTRIPELKIGDITLYNISANLNPGMGGDEILLGMSALKQLEFSQKDEWLLLRQ